MEQGHHSCPGFVLWETVLFKQLISVYLQLFSSVDKLIKKKFQSLIRFILVVSESDCVRAKSGNLQSTQRCGRRKWTLSENITENNICVCSINSAPLISPKLEMCKFHSVMLLKWTSSPASFVSSIVTLTSFSDGVLQWGCLLIC